MKLYEVTEGTAIIMQALSDEHYLHFIKSQICDVMCSVIDRAEVNGTIAEDLKLLIILSDTADAVTELSRCREISDQTDVLKH